MLQLQRSSQPCIAGCSLRRGIQAVAALIVLVVRYAQTASQKPRRKVHLYTFSDTLPHPGLCVLAEATAELGGILRVLGLSKKPGYLLIQSHSPTLKFIMLQEVVEYEMSIGRIAADDLMIFVDGHDVLLQRPLADLLAAYERWPGSPYLISGEKNCWPWPHSEPIHGKWDPGMAVNPNKTWVVNKYLQLGVRDFCRVVARRGPYPYPNIGTSMGPVWRMLEVLKRNNRIVLEEDMNDQGAMWLVILRHAVELHIEIDQNAEVFMNMLQYEPGELEREPCVPGWFADAPSGNAGAAPQNGSKLAAPAALPPQNRMTKAVPAMLHFNGPSHEDSVWPSCFYAFSQQFRKTGKGHSFFDIDHNIQVSTDYICDYSFYKIRDFHAHPLNEQSLTFLEQFHQLPVDPGLLAWRGNASAGDSVNFGTEADLYPDSHHLRKVMGMN
mmetsp:Transcript_152606/g.292238  ORF Transcript_152606/g.292238 Transcript_152606/m.292238 type:complete len:440 (-) Transcript_152606:64-1383(-)